MSCPLKGKVQTHHPKNSNPKDPDQMNKYRVRVQRTIVEEYDMDLEAPTKRDAEQVVLSMIRDRGEAFFVNPLLKHLTTDKTVGRIRPSHVRARQVAG